MPAPASSKPQNVDHDWVQSVQNWANQPPPPCWRFSPTASCLDLDISRWWDRTWIATVILFFRNVSSVGHDAQGPLVWSYVHCVQILVSGFNTAPGPWKGMGTQYTVEIYLIYITYCLVVYNLWYLMNFINPKYGHFGLALYTSHHLQWPGREEYSVYK